MTAGVRCDSCNLRDGQSSKSTSKKNEGDGGAHERPKCVAIHLGLSVGMVPRVYRRGGDRGDTQGQCLCEAQHGCADQTEAANIIAPSYRDNSPRGHISARQLGNGTSWKMAWSDGRKERGQAHILCDGRGRRARNGADADESGRKVQGLHSVYPAAAVRTQECTRQGGQAPPTSQDRKTGWVVLWIAMARVGGDALQVQLSGAGKALVSTRR